MLVSHAFSLKKRNFKNSTQAFHKQYIICDTLSIHKLSVFHNDILTLHDFYQANIRHLIIRQLMLARNQVITINRVTSAKQIIPLSNIQNEDIPFRPSILTQKSNRENSKSPNSTSPNKLNSARLPHLLKRQKPSLACLLQPTHSATPPKIQCPNHPKRAVQFRVFINGQVKFCCERCATQFASQGLKVDKLEGEKSNKKCIIIPQAGKYEGFPRAMEITEFLQSLKIVEKSLKDNTRALNRLEDHYRAKLEQVENFYSEMIDYIHMVKMEHMRVLKAEARKYVQIALIQCGNNEQNLNQIDSIVFDIESQMESIVKVISEDQFKKCLRQYTKNLQFYNHASEEQQNIIRQVTVTNQNNMLTKLSELKTFVHHLYEDQDRKETGTTFSFDKSEDNHTIINPVGQTAKTVRPSAFRNLFEDSDNNPIESPMFKLI